MTISDNLTPRERQIRETLAGVRGDLDDEPTPTRAKDYSAPDTGPVPLTVEARAKRAAQVERERTQWWWCPRCRTRVQGSGTICPTCDPDAA